jgi:hypothetical protein
VTVKPVTRLDECQKLADELGVRFGVSFVKDAKPVVVVVRERGACTPMVTEHAASLQYGAEWLYGFLAQRVAAKRAQEHGSA